MFYKSRLTIHNHLFYHYLLHVLISDNGIRILCTLNVLYEYMPHIFLYKTDGFLKCWLCDRAWHSDSSYKSGHKSTNDKNRTPLLQQKMKQMWGKQKNRKVRKAKNRKIHNGIRNGWNGKVQTELPLMKDGFDAKDSAKLITQTFYPEDLTSNDNVYHCQIRVEADKMKMTTHPSRGGAKSCVRILQSQKGPRNRWPHIRRYEDRYAAKPMVVHPRSSWSF